MCSVKEGANKEADQVAALASINGRPVLQPAASSWNRIRATLGRQNSSEKTLKKLGIHIEKVKITHSDVLCKSPGKIVGGPGEISITDGGSRNEGFSSACCSSSIVKSPGSIAAVRREQMALQQAQRKMRIAHYGRSKSSKYPEDDNFINHTNAEDLVIRRCSFITPNTDSIYVRYHDEEWGVPVHDDRLLFEFLVLSSAQVGSDWASIIKKRQSYRTAFFDFDPATVAAINEKQKQIISVQHAMEISHVRGIVDNANRILEIKKEFSSFDAYIWGFVNNKPITTRYRFGNKIPVKTSKSDGISKDMVRRGFRFVGPTAIHSFMQAAGLTNDHLVTCHRHVNVASKG